MESGSCVWITHNTVDNVTNVFMKRKFKQWFYKYQQRKQSPFSPQIIEHIKKELNISQWKSRSRFETGANMWWDLLDYKKYIKFHPIVTEMLIIVMDYITLIKNRTVELLYSEIIIK